MTPVNENQEPSDGKSDDEPKKVDLKKKLTMKKMNWATVLAKTVLPDEERKSAEVSDLVLMQSKIEKKR